MFTKEEIDGIRALFEETDAALGCTTEVWETGELICERCGTISEETVQDGLCDSCVIELNEHERLVNEGGVYWKCVDCHQSGVVRNSEYSQHIRELLEVPAPDPCAVEFSKNDCPACSEE